MKHCADGANLKQLSVDNWLRYNELKTQFDAFPSGLSRRRLPSVVSSLCLNAKLETSCTNSFDTRWMKIHIVLAPLLAALLVALIRITDHVSQSLNLSHTGGCVACFL